MHTGGTWFSRGILRQNSIDIPIDAQGTSYIWSPWSGVEYRSWPAPRVGPTGENSVHIASCNCRSSFAFGVSARSWSGRLLPTLWGHPPGDPRGAFFRKPATATPFRLHAYEPTFPDPPAHILGEKRKTSVRRDPDRLSNCPASWLRVGLEVNAHMNGTSM